MIAAENWRGFIEYFELSVRSAQKKGLPTILVGFLFVDARLHESHASELQKQWRRLNGTTGDLIDYYTAGWCEDRFVPDGFDGIVENLKEFGLDLTDRLTSGPCLILLQAQEYYNYSNSHAHAGMLLKTDRCIIKSLDTDQALVHSTERFASILRAKVNLGYTPNVTSLSDLLVIKALYELARIDFSLAVSYLSGNGKAISAATIKRLPQFCRDVLDAVTKEIESEGLVVIKDLNEADTESTRRV